MTDTENKAGTTLPGNLGTRMSESLVNDQRLAHQIKTVNSDADAITALKAMGVEDSADPLYLIGQMKKEMGK